ncbi:ferrous iron transporter B [Rubritalea marina]|uniref:ferrous iron transporter B n=1 Tax=Rubritalea marina TaxID=361055 RepID=UPI00038194DF|nr:ferrous iron transporter B [Rubritalea marina]
MSTGSPQLLVALVGNPNAGKTTLFNSLTGQNQKVGNYSGVTVSRKSGEFRTPHGVKVELIDLPGCYSLEPQSADEKVTHDVLCGEQDEQAKPDLTICVVDASALERHLHLALEVIALGHPVVLALNMVDLAEAQGIHLDPTILSEELGVPIVPIQANKHKGLIELKQALGTPLPRPASPKWNTRGNADERQQQRTKFIKEICNEAARREDDGTLTLTDRLDSFLLAPVTGWITLIAVMYAVFWTIFSLSSYPMDFIEGSFASLGDWVASAMPEGDLNDLLVEGIIGGLSGTLVFLPQIVILFFFIALMEASGYMARAAILMDRVMNLVGLSGKSFLPLLSSHACAIPGVMATRTIDSAKERLITILIAPWMSCSARLPVYTLLITMLLPLASSFTQAMVMLAVYFTGIITALIAARILKGRIAEDETPSHFMLELPPYRLPQPGYLARHIVDRAYAFLKRAGSIILALCIILWALETYPKPAEDSPAAENASLALEQSYMGQIGHVIEPVFKPLGYDWRTSTAVVMSFAAREVFKSSLQVTYNVSEELDEGQADTLLHEKLAKATWPDGSKIYTPATLLSLLVFFIYALQCLPTSAVVARETNSYKWAIGQLVGMSAFAYVAALVVFQVASIFLK